MSDDAPVEKELNAPPAVVVPRKGFPGRVTHLNEEVTRHICAYIEGGAFAWVAAVAAGVTKRTFDRWLQRGAAGEEGYKEFAERVESARARARVRAEVAVMQSKPDVWLTRGPGKERSGEPGWGDPMQNPKPLGSHVVNGQVVPPSAYDFSRLSDEEALQLEALLEKSRLALPSGEEQQ